MLTVYFVTVPYFFALIYIIYEFVFRIYIEVFLI